MRSMLCLFRDACVVLRACGVVVMCVDLGCVGERYPLVGDVFFAARYIRLSIMPLLFRGSCLRHCVACTHVTCIMLPCPYAREATSFIPTCSW